MKSKSFRVILWLSVLVLAVSSSAGGAQKIRLAVLDVASDAKLVQQSGIIADTFTGTLAKSGAVALAERQELETVIREQKISASELEGAAPRIGSIMGCQYMLLCSVKYEDSPVVAVRLVDAETSGVVYSDTELPDALDRTALTAAGSRMADRLLEVLAGEQAVITELRGREITINRGSSSGVRAGNFYRVYSGTKRNHVNLAVIRVKDVRPGFSTAEIVKNSGNISVLRKSDKIEAVSKKEADSLVKARKFAKKRPGEKQAAAPVNTALSKLESLLDEEKAFFAERTKYIDSLKKRGEAAVKTNDPKAINNIGKEWIELGESMMKYIEADKVDEQLRKLDAVNVDISLNTQDYIRKRTDLFRENVQICFGTARTFFKIAADKGNETARRNLEIVDTFYANNTNPDKAAELLRKHADDDTEVQAALGLFYLFGLGVQQDHAKAFELFSKAAEKGNIDAVAGLGAMYLKGYEVRENPAKALELISRAANEGSAFGQTLLGAMYAQGNGVPQDFRKARELFRKADAQGFPLAKKFMQEFELY